MIMILPICLLFVLEKVHLLTFLPLKMTRAVISMMQSLTRLLPLLSMLEYA